MTFEDEITAAHWQDMLSGVGNRKERLIAWGGLSLGVAMFIAVLSGMAVFGYAVFQVFVRKGLDGVLAEPMIPALMVAGLLVSAFAVFYLKFDKWLIAFFWGLRKGPPIEPGMLRPDINVGRARFTLSDDEIEIRMPHDLDKVKWGAVRELRETADTFLLMFSDKIGLVVPKAQLLSAGKVEHARAIMTSGIGKAPA